MTTAPEVAIRFALRAAPARERAVEADSLRRERTFRAAYRAATYFTGAKRARTELTR